MINMLFSSAAEMDSPCELPLLSKDQNESHMELPILGSPKARDPIATKVHPQISADSNPSEDSSNSGSTGSFRSDSGGLELAATFGSSTGDQLYIPWGVTWVTLL